MPCCVESYTWLCCLGSQSNSRHCGVWLFISQIPGLYVPRGSHFQLSSFFYQDLSIHMFTCFSGVLTLHSSSLQVVWVGSGLVLEPGFPE